MSTYPEVIVLDCHGLLTDPGVTKCSHTWTPDMSHDSLIVDHSEPDFETWKVPRVIFAQGKRYPAYSRAPIDVKVGFIPK